MLQPESLYRLVFPSDPQISPDGKTVAFVVTRIEEDEKNATADDKDKSAPKPRYKSAIYLSDGGEPRQLTSGEKRDGAPRWSPDGRHLTFTSTRDGKPQLYLLPLHGGEARKLTRFESGAGDAKWSPDGRTLAFLSHGDWKDEAAERGEGRVVTRTVYKFNGQGFLPERPRSLYLLDVQSGEARELYRHPVELDDFTWLPGGDGLLIAGAPDDDARAAWASEVYRLDLGGNAKQITDWRSTIGSLAPHPDGQRFVALAVPHGKGSPEDSHAFEFDMNGNARRVDEGVDRPAGCSVAGDCHVGAMPARPTWVGDDLQLLYSFGGSCGLFALQGGSARPVVHDETRVVPAFTKNANGQAYIQESTHEFPEVYLNGAKVTDLAKHLGDFPRREAERVTVTTEGGEVEGWVLRPEQQGIPALLTIHGGPHTSYGHGFMHEFQLFAQRGYAVCYSNPRGSSGYGQAGNDSIFGRWGTIDHDDLMAFFDACLAKHPDLDRNRTAVMGGSYGGYMTNWITGHTDRFKAAITDRSICNLISFNGTSDIAPRFWPFELGLSFVNPQDIEGLWNMSPLKYVDRVSTPTLIIHSEEDHRCPVEQAEQWYTALRLRGIETRMVRFPEENHELSRSGRPDRRAQRLTEYLNWLDGHLQQD